MEVKGPQSVTYFRLMEVKGPQPDIIKINGSEGASISNIINISGSEGASMRDITKTSFLNVLGHFQRTLLFDHEQSDIIKINGSDEVSVRDTIKINESKWASYIIIEVKGPQIGT